MSSNEKPEQPAGICTCGAVPEDHDPTMLSYHHYWYMHNGTVRGCTICERRDRLISAALNHKDEPVGLP